jgi:hypothetical protein
MKTIQYFPQQAKSGKSIFRLFLIVFFFSLSFLAQSQDKNLVAIGNLTGVPATMKLSELKAVMMGEQQRWKSGNRVLIALMKTNTPLGKQVAEEIFDMTGDGVNKYWLALVFQGKAQAPNFFSSVAELESFVAQNPGAIGIMNKPSNSDEIKTILIDGQKTF